MTRALVTLACLFLLPLVAAQAQPTGSASADTAPSHATTSNDCGLIGDSDLRAFCRGDCGLIGDSDMRSMCRQDCGLIGDSDQRYLCRKDCGLVSDSDMRSLCRSDRPWPGK